MEKNSLIDLSVIIPIYNVENYLPECIDSVIHQAGLRLEIILVDDGSTDRSGDIADQYAQKDSRIKVIHQENGEASAARNAGLDIAQGEYIAFVDSDDCLKENSLSTLYDEAVRFQADVVVGKVEFGHTDGAMSYYRPVPEEMMYISYTGKEAFVQLMKTGSYRPMVWNYIYRSAFLEEIQARFVTGTTPHEDELWMPVVLCQASKTIMIDTEFYYHRQREESVMYSTQLKKRLNAYVRVANLLFEFTDRYDFSGMDAAFKNWMYVNILDRLQYAFSFLSRIRDSSYRMPSHPLDRYWRYCWEMMPEPQKICHYYFRRAERWLKAYTDWRTSEWVASIKYEWLSGKKMMLLFNTKSDLDLSLKTEDVPTDWVITTDRRFLQEADLVVFHIPYLIQELENDIDKPEKQIWAGWYMEAEKNYPELKNPEFVDLFDLWMSYKKDANVMYPFYRNDYAKFFTQQLVGRSQLNKALMIFSNKLYEKNQHEYLGKLMKYIEFDSYYEDLAPIGQIESSHSPKKQHRYRNYKFVIAFEDVADTDYVTDKFYDPLLAGSVPVYLGAPNIEDFAPGDNCFVDVRQFENPESLADFIKKCYEDEQLYATFFEWRDQPLRQSFLSKIEEQKEHPLVRLCRKVDEMNKNI
jgi:glycosyltransferase involved in cell wall biosynthesis